MNLNKVGDGNVVLIAGGGKTYTDVAARFVGSEKSLSDIVASPYDKKIVDNVLSSNHKAVTEFDYFVFGIEGFSRVTETQMVRKRIGSSYVIKSGRNNKNGKRNFDIVLPEHIQNHSCDLTVKMSDLKTTRGISLSDLIDTERYDDELTLCMYPDDILRIVELWYNTGVEAGYPEEDLRYLKPQATEFKAIVGMNARSLFEFFGERCCLNAQTEIRDLASKMLKLCKESSPDLFKDAGPKCKSALYCPENGRQNKSCKGKIVTKDEAKVLLRK